PTATRSARLPWRQTCRCTRRSRRSARPSLRSSRRGTASPSRPCRTTQRREANGWHLSNSFGERLRTAVDESGRLCVGIDPHAYLLRDWGLADTAGGVRELSLRVIDAIGDAAAAIKPQVACFQRHGAAGYAVLEEVLATAREAGLLLIADAKRGDVGTSVEAYGQAWLTPGSPLEADALTVSAFQGVASLASVLDLAAREGKGLFVLAATSN